MGLETKAEVYSTYKLTQIIFSKKSDKTAQKGSLTLIDQGIVSIANFLTGVIIGRVCSKEEFGLYLLGFTIITFIQDIQGSFISMPYTIYIPRLKGIEKAQYTGSTLVHQYLLSVLAILILAITHVIIPAELWPKGFLSVIVALLFMIASILMREYIRRVCFAIMQMKIALILDISVGVLQVSGLLLLTYYSRLSASAAYIAIGTACGIISVIWLYVNRRNLSVRFAKVMSDLRQNLSTGKWIYASSLLWGVGSYPYPWILTSFHGTEAAGVWAACLGVVTFCNPLFLGMQNFLTPLIAQSYANGGKNELRHYTFKVTAIFGTITAICTILFTAFGDSLAILFYGDKYYGNNTTISILAFNLLAISLGFCYSRALFVVGRADIDFKINFISLIVLFSIGLYMVIAYGPLGAASALLIGNLLSLGFRLMAFKKIVNN